LITELDGSGRGRGDSVDQNLAENLPLSKPHKSKEPQYGFVPGTHPPLGIGRAVVLPCLLLFGSMFNLTLVVAGLKEFIIDDLGGTVTDATLFFSVETIAYILFAPVWGLMSDRLGSRKPFVVIGFLASSALYATYWFVPSVSVLLTIRFVQGAAAVMGWSTVMAMLMDNPDRERHGRYMGFMGASLILGVALGAPTGGYLTRWLGSRAPVLGAAVLFFVLAILALIGLRETWRERASPTREILSTLLGTPKLLLPYSLHFVDRFAVGLFVVVFPLYLDSLGAGDAAVRGRFLSYFLVPFALLQVFTGRMTERTGPLKPLVLGSGLYGIVLCTVGYADLYLLTPIMGLLGIFAAIMFPPAILLTSQLASPGTRGSAMGGFNVAGSLGFAIGPLVGGAIYASHGFGVAFVVCGMLEVTAATVALIVCWRWFEPQPA